MVQASPPAGIGGGADLGQENHRAFGAENYAGPCRPPATR